MIKPLKVFVGVDGRFVLCEKFPNDEDHAGLHELLDEFVKADIYLSNEDLEIGFYKVTLDLEYDAEWTPDRSSFECYLIAKSIEPYEM